MAPTVRSHSATTLSIVGRRYKKCRIDINLHHWGHPALSEDGHILFEPVCSRASDNIPCHSSPGCNRPRRRPGSMLCLVGHCATAIRTGCFTPPPRGFDTVSVPPPMWGTCALNAHASLPRHTVKYFVPSHGPEYLSRDRPIPWRLSNSYPPLTSSPTPQPRAAGVPVWEK